jgi:hypothetical protein
MGTGSGIGMDLVESENVPTEVQLLDENEKPHQVSRFSMGQNTMMIQDENSDIYITGLKIHYTPKRL